MLKYNTLKEDKFS